MDDYFGLAALDGRIWRNIRTSARRLCGTCTIPGMHADDIAQDLFLDLWRRRHAYDPIKGTFPTFADRIITNRVATLACPTARLKAERRQVWLDAPIDDDGADTLADTVADPATPTEDGLALLLDMRRFVAGLTPTLRRCAEILLAQNIRLAAASAGLHHSTVYEHAQRLRATAEAAGLKTYVTPPRHHAARAGMCPT